MPTLFGLARLGRDTEVRYTPSGEAVCNLSLAFNVRKGQEKLTQWVDGSLWGKRAEALAPYLLKGGAVSVTLEGVHIEEFKGRDGTPGHKLVGRVMDVELAGGREAQADDGSGARPQPSRRSAAPAAPAPAPARNAYADARAGKPPAPAPRPSTSFDDMDDDIPF